MICLVVKTPLAEDDICARIFNSFHHIDEVVLLHLLQLFVIFDRLNLESVFRFGLWRLERASQNYYLSVVDFLLHLRVRKVFINNDALNKLRILNSAACLCNDFDEVEVDVFALKICNVKNGFNCQVCEVILTLAYYLRAQSGCGALAQELVVVL